MNEKYLKSLINLNNYCNKQQYRGYSLYDSHLSPIPFNMFGHNVSFLINQIVKRSPINIRKIIRVKKSYNPKGMGLFLYSYVIQKRIGNPLNIKDIDSKINFFYDWLKNNYSKGYSGYCWGYHYPWPKSDGILVPSLMPNSVVTAFNIRAIFEYYLIKNDESCIDIINSASQFILNDIPIFENDDGICFAYTPLKSDIIINANLLAAEILTYTDYVNKSKNNQPLIKKVLEFTMKHQNDDGSWYYSFNPKTWKPKKQIDFHQGYVLETINRICDYSNIELIDIKKHIKKGLKFYKKNQFSSDGISKWRHPKQWPVDIHNQSQGIITFSIFKEFDDSYEDFSKNIAKWTIQNMQSHQGNFYYQKWPIISNKVSYMRWNQAWMMLALSVLLEKIKK